jgi:translation elongation factor EF-Tu-like GTPase
MYCRTYDIGVKGVAPEGREMIMPGEDATMTLYISKRMVCFLFLEEEKTKSYLGIGKRRSIYIT